MTFAQYIVFTDQMLKSAVNDTAKDFSEIAADAYSTVIIGVKFVSTFVDWGDQTLVPHLREDARAEDNVEEFSIAYLNLWSVYFII